MYKFLLFLSSFCISMSVFAEEPTGIGGVANNLMGGPVNYISDFIYSACFIIGGSFVFASIVKYVEHRRNPLAVPMGTVIFLLIAGLFLLGLPFAYLLTHGGLPYTLLI